MNFETLYTALVEAGRVTITRDMWPRLAEFVYYCRARGVELRGGFEVGDGIEIFLK